jgi:EmrB/QacA subfamily drug resistance transporter
MDAPATPRAARSPWIGFSAVSVGTFMATLDSSIVNVALPTLRAELHASFAAVAWIVSAYLLAIAATLLTAGRLGDLLGHRRVYVGGLLLFTVGSGLCGAAPSLGALVAARVVQALGAAATMAMGPAVVTALFPPERRGRALGGTASVVALGLTFGPPLGGVIVQQLSWRWIFLVNLPVGVAGAIWAGRVLPAERPDLRASLDRPGAALLAVALAAGVSAIEGAPRAAALAAVAVVAGALLLRRLRREEHPVVDLRLFASPVFTGGIVGGLLSYAALFNSSLLTPFFLAQVKGLGPRDLGAMLTAVPIALSVASPAAGSLADRFGPRVLCPLGALVLAAGLGSLALAGPGDGLASIAARLALCGVGMGLYQPPNNNAVMGTLPRDRLGSGGGMLATARVLGQVLGIALASALFRARGGGALGGGTSRFLAGYATALGTGAALALAAGLVVMARDRRGRAPARSTSS